MHYVYNPIEPDKTFYVWWCKVCPVWNRWQVMATNEWTEHIAQHIMAMHPEGL